MTKKIIELDREEKMLLGAFEKGELKSVRNIKAEKQTAKNAAERFTRKDARINIRLSSYDVDRIKMIAAEEGLSYQTLIASILHKFAASRMKV